MSANLSSAVIVLVLATGLTGAQDHERTPKENYVIRTTGAAIDVDIDVAPRAPASLSRRRPGPPPNPLVPSAGAPSP